MVAPIDNHQRTEHQHTATANQPLGRYFLSRNFRVAQTAGPLQVNLDRVPSDIRQAFASNKLKRVHVKASMSLNQATFRPPTNETSSQPESASMERDRGNFHMEVSEIENTRDARLRRPRRSEHLVSLKLQTGQYLPLAREIEIRGKNQAQIDELICSRLTSLVSTPTDLSSNIVTTGQLSKTRQRFDSIAGYSATAWIYGFISLIAIPTLIVTNRINHRQAMAERHQPLDSLLNK